MSEVVLTEDSTQVEEKQQCKADLTFADEVLEKLNGFNKNTEQNIAALLPLNDIVRILQLAAVLLMEDGSLVETDGPIKIIGDIHGQFRDLLNLFDLVGHVPETNTGIWWDFQALFNRMPLAGVVGKQILCMHGGLSPELTSLDVIRNIPRPCEPTDKGDHLLIIDKFLGLLIDLLWADPTNKGDGWYYSPRGLSYMFGKGVVAAACTQLNIELIVRAHQVVQDGYELMVGRRLVTIFSAPNYCGEFANSAAVSFQQMHVPSANKRIAPPVANDESQKPSDEPLILILPPLPPPTPMRSPITDDRPDAAKTPESGEKESTDKATKAEETNKKEEPEVKKEETEGDKEKPETKKEEADGEKEKPEAPKGDEKNNDEK